MNNQNTDTMKHFFTFFITLLFITSCSSNKNLTQCPSFKQLKENKSIVHKKMKAKKKPKQDKVDNQKIAINPLKKAIRKIDKTVIVKLDLTELLNSLQFEEQNIITSTFREIKGLEKLPFLSKNDKLGQTILENRGKEAKEILNKIGTIQHEDRSEINHLRTTTKKIEWRAIASVVLAVIGSFFIYIGGSFIAALLGTLLCIISFNLGVRSLKKINRSNNLKGEGLAITGIILSGIALLLMLLVFIVITALNN